jgi:hypothetical protein
MGQNYSLTGCCASGGFPILSDGAPYIREEFYREIYCFPEGNRGKLENNHRVLGRGSPPTSEQITLLEIAKNLHRGQRVFCLAHYRFLEVAEGNLIAFDSFRYKFKILYLRNQWKSARETLQFCGFARNKAPKF